MSSNTAKGRRMGKKLTQEITDCIEAYIEQARGKKLVIYPCGDIGIRFIEILRNVYGLEAGLIIDDNKYKYSRLIQPSEALGALDVKEYVVIIVSTNKYIYQELKATVMRFFSIDNIIELECMKNSADTVEKEYSVYETKIGKYSYGPICVKNHPWISSIGNFCSFAKGVDYVSNHEIHIYAPYHV